MTRVFVPGPDGDLVELATKEDQEDVQEALEVAKDLTEALLDPDLIPDQSHAEYLDGLLAHVLGAEEEDTRYFPPRKNEAREMSAHLGIMLTNVATLMHHERYDDAMEELQRARDYHATLLEVQNRDQSTAGSGQCG